MKDGKHDGCIRTINAHLSTLAKYQLRLSKLQEALQNIASGAPDPEILADRAIKEDVVLRAKDETKENFTQSTK